jgi:hypothetical protein
MIEVADYTVKLGGDIVVNGLGNFNVMSGDVDIHDDSF